MEGSVKNLLESEYADQLPETELMIIEKEKTLGLGEMAFLDFCYTVKRFTYNGNVLNDEVFKRICPELGLDWEQVNNEAEMSP